MSEAKANILKSLQANLVSIAESRIIAKIQHDKFTAELVASQQKKYEQDLKRLDERQAGVEAEIKSVEAV